MNLRALITSALDCFLLRIEHAVTPVKGRPAFLVVPNICSACFQEFMLVSWFLVALDDYNNRLSPHG